MNNEYRLQIIKENYNNLNEGDETIKEYTLREAENDPRFFNWFFGFDADNISDFGIGMTEEQKKEWNEFLELL